MNVRTEFLALSNILENEKQSTLLEKRRFLGASTYSYRRNKAACQRPAYYNQIQTDRRRSGGTFRLEMVMSVGR